jgi:BMFP domain-containing protein YqiC
MMAEISFITEVSWLGPAGPGERRGSIRPNQASCHRCFLDKNHGAEYVCKVFSGALTAPIWVGRKGKGMGAHLFGAMAKAVQGMRLGRCGGRGIWTTRLAGVTVAAMEPKHLDDFAQRLMDSLPKGLQQLQADAGKNLQSALQAALGRMNLVSREEFDIQAAVLARSRAKLDQLERQIAELERRLAERQD